MKVLYNYIPIRKALAVLRYYRISWYVSLHAIFITVSNRITVTEASAFNFVKKIKIKMHAELSCQWRECLSTFDEVGMRPGWLRSAQVNLPDVAA